MSGYRLVWLEIAERQYRSQPPEMRALIDRRLGWPAGDPFAEPGTVYDRRSDHYSIPLGDRGFLVYAVVNEPLTVVVLRVILL